MELRRFTSRPDPAALVHLTASPTDLGKATESYGIEVDLEPAVELASLIARKSGSTTGSEARLAPHLFMGLRGLSNRVLNDTGMWAWLAIGPFSQFTVYRWLDLGRLPEAEDVTPAVYKRFVPNATLNGFARHSVARIFWAARTLWTDEEGFELVDTVLGNQDFYQNVFERLLVLHPPAARACARAMKEGSEDQRRSTIIDLNLVLSTVLAESLSDDRLTQLVSDLFDNHRGP